MAKRTSQRSTSSSSSKGPKNGKRLLRKAVLLGGLVAALYVGYCAVTLPDIDEDVELKRRPSLVLRYSDGSILARYGERSGKALSIEEMPLTLREAVISIEDRRFYYHFGIDPFGLVRAVFVNIFHGRYAQGASTITQQLAKNLFLSPEKSLTRKVQEALIALWLEHHYTKDEILAAYLNRVYFGAGAYGVEAASQTYFGKSARDLSLRESATLAGLLKAPSRYSPLSAPGAAEGRTALVFAAMEDAGFLTEGQYKAIVDAPPLPRHKPGSSGNARYFADWVVDQVQEVLGEAPPDVIVDTTLDIGAQRLADQAADDSTANATEQGASQLAIVTLGPDGAVEALVGGRDWRDSQFNRVTQAHRQPGSSFKPFVYLAAIHGGFTPDTIVNDQPIRIGKYAPTNFDNRYRGEIPLKEALAESLNTVSVQLAESVGVNKVIEVARRFGITSKLTPDLSLALGSSEVTPLELAAAYAAIGRGGVAVEPYAIRRIVTTGGKVLYQRQEAKSPQIWDADEVATLQGMMAGVVDHGTGKAAQLGVPVIGKTGTSSDYRDAWFIGIAGGYTTAVWFGNDDNRPMRQVTGGGLPAHTWHGYMQSALSVLPAGGGNALASSDASGDAAPAATEARDEQPDTGGLDEVFSRIFGGDDKDKDKPKSARTAPPEHVLRAPSNYQERPVSNDRPAPDAPP